MDVLERVVVYRRNTIVSIVRRSGGNIYQSRILVLDEAFQSSLLSTEFFAASPEEVSIKTTQHAKQWIDQRDWGKTASDLTRGN
jgi:hypothetical protein